MASNDWLVAILEARSIPKRTSEKVYHPSILNTDPNVYVSLAIISSGDLIPNDGRCTRRPFGMLIGYDQHINPKAEKFPLENESVVWNTAVTVRKAISSGSRALVTVWDKDALRPDSLGGGKEDVMLGKVVIELPPPDQVQWYTLKSYEGIAVVDESDKEKPLFSVKVEITRPGQTLSLYAETSIRSKDKDSKVLRRPPLLYSEKHSHDDVDKRIGYTPGNIREYIQVQDTKELERELMLGHDINHELLRMAEDEELMQSQNPYVEIPRSVGNTLHPALQGPPLPVSEPIAIQNTPFLRPQSPPLYAQPAPIPTTLRLAQPSRIAQTPLMGPMQMATPMMAPMAEPMSYMVPSTPNFAPQYGLPFQQQYGPSIGYGYKEF